MAVFNKLVVAVARSTPETPMQRVGALVIMINTLFCLVFIAVLIQDAWDLTWTASGVGASVFGATALLMMLPFCLAHGVAAVFPRLFKRLQCRPASWEGSSLFFFEPLRDMYSVVGWFAAICFAALAFYGLFF